MKTKTEYAVITSMFLAIGIILPFATSHGLGIQGTVLLPMHIPVFLCGFLCGPLYGCLCGLILPILNSILTAMPSLYPMMPIMAGELAVYGLISGFMYHKTPIGKKKFGIYACMLTAMISGRIVYGLIFNLLMLISGELKALSVWSAIITGIPGIIIQFLLIPAVVFVVERAMNSGNNNAIESAKYLISEKKATCVVIKDGKIINIEYGNGISPIIEMYEKGLLSGAVVVDKIVGKAAAMIMVLGGVKACYGITMSKAAIEYLKGNNISAQWENSPEYIINRKGDDICPMEKTVKDIEDPKKALEALKAKLRELNVIN